MNNFLVSMSLFILSGCLGYPEAIAPVKDFNLSRYLGKWYEIARLDHSFERGLQRVTAEYSMREDGGVRVINRGFSVDKNGWQEAEGKAYFVRGTDEGYLKVSFFGPFYGSYVVFELERQEYQYAFVASSNMSYLWLLSRTPEISKQIQDQFETRLKEIGFNVEELIYVEQD